jgi:opacity protein-like surface antigen
MLAGATRVGLTLSAAALAGGIPVPLVGGDGATTEFTLHAGGGFDFPLTSRWSGRVTADYLRVFTEGAPTHGVRVAVGWVVPLAR